MNDKQILGLIFIVAIITGVAIGAVINSPLADAGDNEVDDTRYLLDDCSIRVVGDFHCIDVFNQYHDSSDWDGDYYGVILKHCVFVEQENVVKAFTAENGRFDTGYKFIFQFVSQDGYPSSEEFLASSGITYYLKYRISNGLLTTLITITLYMA